MKNYIIGGIIILILVTGILAYNKDSESEIGFASVASTNIFDTFSSANATTTSGDTTSKGLKILGKNLNRQYARICNESTAIVWLSFATGTADITAEKNKGARLNSSAVGDNCFEILPENLYRGEVRATSSAAGSNVITFIEK